jgi:hypothetical protein
MNLPAQAKCQSSDLRKRIFKPSEKLERKIYDASINIIIFSELDL